MGPEKISGPEKEMHMTGFKNFILRGNLVELAVAFIMGLAFASVVTATVTLIMDLIGKIGGQPDFAGWKPGGVSLGAWITAVIAFLILAAVVYFLIVMPYTKAKDRYFPAEEEGTPADVALLEEIRDLLATRGGAAGTTAPPTGV
jgi:large conductance mechanosensitive channel